METLFKQVLGGSLAGLAATLLSAAAAQAASPCQGAAPPPGQALHGPVLHVLDGERLCLARGDSPRQWIELRLAPPPLQKAAATPAPSRGALMGVAFAQNVTCRIVGASDGEALAACAVGGRDLAALARSPQAAKISHAWR